MLKIFAVYDFSNFLFLQIRKCMISALVIYCLEGFALSRLAKLNAVIMLIKPNVLLQKYALVKIY